MSVEPLVASPALRVAPDVEPPRMRDDGRSPAPADGSPASLTRLVVRRDLCGLARPSLALPQHTRRFRFFDTTLVRVLSGQLSLDDGHTRLDFDAGSPLLLVDAHACADLRKTPGGGARRFQSMFLTFPPALVAAFHRETALADFSETTGAERSRPPFQTVALDADLLASLQHAVQGVEQAGLSDARLQHRLMDLLHALAERGFRLPPPLKPTTSGRLRALFGDTPGHHWTAQAAGRELAMSEATLRRRLAAEQTGFESLLVEVRMHHAMMLLQTTGWNLARIAEACGYRSRARFAERFKERFGTVPSRVR